MPASKTDPVLAILLEEIGHPGPLDAEAPIEVLVQLLLCERTDARRAGAALKRFKADCVDWNEVRVTPEHELRVVMKSFGRQAAAASAKELRAALQAVYHRFNKVDLSVFVKPDGNDEQRRRERFDSWLSDEHAALAAMLRLVVDARREVCVEGGLPRTLQRLGWLPKGTSSQVAVKTALDEHGVLPEDLLAVQWGVLRVAEQWCHQRSPDCRSCLLKALCPSADLSAPPPKPPPAEELPVDTGTASADAEDQPESESKRGEKAKAAKKPNAGAKASAGAAKRPSKPAPKAAGASAKPAASAADEPAAAGEKATKRVAKKASKKPAKKATKKATKTSTKKVSRTGDQAKKGGSKGGAGDRDAS